MSNIMFVAEWFVEDGPDGIAIGPSGEVYVNINNSHHVVKYSAEGELLVEWSLDGEPSDIAVGPDGEVHVNINNSHRVVNYGPNGEVYVAVNNNHRVVKYSVEGIKLREWLSEGEASGIVVNPAGEIFVNINNSHRVMEYNVSGEISVNINNSHRIVKYSSEGDQIEEWPAEGETSGIAISPDGDVSSITNVLRVEKHGEWGDPISERSVVAGVIETNGIAVGPDGEVYVTLNNSHRVVKYSPEGELLAEWGGEGNLPGEFRSPVDLALGPNGLLFVADKGNSRIQVFRCF